MGQVPPSMQASRKLLRAVADLHTRGYQRLRIMPYCAAVGAWRCVIAPAANFSSRHGARLAGVDEHRMPRYSSADQREYWGWQDGHHCSPGRLAEEFLTRFPEMAALGYGPDWLYAGWYQHMLHLTYPDALPIIFEEYRSSDDVMLMIGREDSIPLPPPGFASDWRPPGSDTA